MIDLLFFFAIATAIYLVLNAFTGLLVKVKRMQKTKANFAYICKLMRSRKALQGKLRKQ